MFIGWGYFLAQIQGPLPVKEPGMEEFPEDAQALAPKSRALGSAPSGLPKSESFQPTTPMPVPIDPFPGEEVLIQVSTGKTHFVISNRGGVIKQLQLPRFYDDDGNIIDLINNPDHLTPALALQANDPEVTAILQNAHYEPSTTSIVLSEFNPEGRLTLTLNHSSGLQVTRTYVFHFNDYMVEMDTQISAPSMASRNLQYQVLLGPGMGGKISSQTDYIVFSGATVFANNERIENPPEDIHNASYFKGDLNWVAFQNKYFGSALIPQQGTKSGLVFKEKDQVFVGLEFESVQSAASAQHLFYAGTKELEILEDKGHHLVLQVPGSHGCGRDLYPHFHHIIVEVEDISSRDLQSGRVVQSHGQSSLGIVFAQNDGSCRRFVVCVLQNRRHFRIVGPKSQCRCQVIGIINQVNDLSTIIVKPRQLQLFDHSAAIANDKMSFPGGDLDENFFSRKWINGNLGSGLCGFRWGRNRRH